MARINRVNNVLDDERDSSTLERLLEFGRKKKYVTYADILHFFPDAEQDLDQLEEASQLYSVQALATRKKTALSKNQARKISQKTSRMKRQ